MPEPASGTPCGGRCSAGSRSPTRSTSSATGWGSSPSRCWSSSRPAAPSRPRRCSSAPASCRRCSTPLLVVRVERGRRPLRAAGHLLRRGGRLRRAGAARGELLACRWSSCSATVDGALALTARALTRAVAAPARARGRASGRQRDPQRRLHRGAALGPAHRAVSSSPGSASSRRCCSTPPPSTRSPGSCSPPARSPRPRPRLGGSCSGSARGSPTSASRTLLRLLVAQAAAFIFFAAVIPVEVIYAKETLDAGDSGYGAVLASWGVGMVIGSVAFADAAAGAARLLLSSARSRSGSRYLGMAARADPARRLRRRAALGGAGNGVQWVRWSAPCRS